MCNPKHRILNQLTWSGVSCFEQIVRGHFLSAMPGIELHITLINKHSSLFGCPWSANYLFMVLISAGVLWYRKVLIDDTSDHNR